MRHHLSIVIALFTFSALADENWTTNEVHYLGSGSNRLEYIIVTNANGKAVKKFKPGEIKQRIYEYNGGLIEKAGSGTGMISVVLSQKSIERNKIVDFISFISLQMRIRMKVTDGENISVKTASKARSATGSNIAIFLIEDESTPASLVAYNDGWAIVNVKPLIKDVPVGIAESRVKKEILRTFALLCGAADSNASGTIMWPVRETSDLDGLKLPERLSPPFIQSIGKHLVRMGFIPTTVDTYRKACEEGWAPAPTNDVQKAIWDKVHELPKSPIKIEYNEKRDKGQ